MVLLSRNAKFRIHLMEKMLSLQCLTHYIKMKSLFQDVQDSFGMWKNHVDSEDVEEYVRNFRKRRHFDI